MKEKRQRPLKLPVFKPRRQVEVQEVDLPSLCDIRKIVVTKKGDVAVVCSSVTYRFERGYETAVLDVPRKELRISRMVEVLPPEDASRLDGLFEELQEKSKEKVL